MANSYDRFAGVQRLVADMAQVERNHRMLGTERQENVVEHSFGVAMLCWRIHSALGLELDLSKILKYAMVHDFPERGIAKDTNAFGSPAERATKKAREDAELARILAEFDDFKDFTTTLTDYQTIADEEARFVWTVDKIQALVHGEMDDWHPYITCGADYDAYCAKGAEWLTQCSPPLYDLLAETIEHGRQFYYDQPDPGDY
jgi:5'-deoxynucleotidase YfbR-like HD superfamily hydrolase